MKVFVEKSKRKNGKLKSELVRDSMGTFSTSLFGAVLGFVQSFVMLSTLEPITKGEYNRVQLIGGDLSTLLGFSISSAIVYFVSRCKIQNTSKSIKKLTAIITILITICGIGSVIFLRNILYPGSTPFFCWATVVYGVFSFEQNICMSILRGENKFKSYNFINLIQKIIVTALMFTMLIWPSAELLVGSIIVIQVFMICLSLYCVYRGNRFTIPDDSIEVSSGTMVQYSLKCHASNVLSYINAQFGTHIVNAFSQSALGIYSTANTIAQQMWLLPDSVNQVLLSRLAAMNNKDDKVKITVMACKIIAYITFLCAIGILGFAQIFVPMLFPKYITSMEPLRFLIPGTIMICYNKLLANSISAYGRPDLNIIPTAIALAVNLPALFLLVPLMEFNGVALATSISFTVQSLCSIVIFCRYTGTKYKRLFLMNREEIETIKRVFFEHSFR